MGDNGNGLAYFDGTNATDYSTGAGFQTPYLKQSLEASNGDLYLINGNMDVEIFSGGKLWPAIRTRPGRSP